MNKRILALAKKNFKEKFIGFFPNTNMPGLPKNYILRILVLLLSYGVMIFFSVLLSATLVALVKNDIIKDADYFTYSAILMSIFIIIFSTYEIISDFYQAKDTEILLSMPLKNDEIFLGKLVGNIASELSYYIFFIVIMVVYFINTSFSLIKLIMGFFSFGALIISVYCILSLLVMVVMRFTNVRKYKTLFKFIGYGLGLAVFGLYYYFIFASDGFDFTDQQIDVAVGTFNNLRLGLERFFFSSSFFGKALGDLNYLAFGGLLLTGILSFLIVKFVASKIYLDSIMEKNQGGSKKRKKKSVANLKATSQTLAMSRKEFSSIIKNPVFLYQSGLLVVMVSAIILSMGKNLNLSQVIAELDPDMKKEVPAIFLGAGLLMASFLFSNNITAFSSLSREGKSFYLIQTLPIDPSSNLMGRFIGLYMINFIASILVSLVSAIVLKLSPIQEVLFFVGMAIGSVFSVFYGLYWGTKKIYTKWTKPAEINKTGLIGFVMFLVSILINVAIYGLAFGIYKVSESITLAIMEVVVGLIVASVLFYLFGVERYKKGFMDVE
jgi:hypothetical protein